MTAAGIITVNLRTDASGFIVGHKTNNGGNGGKLVIAPGGHPQVRWKKGSYDAIEIERSVAGGPWTFATIDMQPHFTDVALELPPAGTALIVRYRAIYHKANEQVGRNGVMR